MIAVIVSVLHDALPRHCEGTGARRLHIGGSQLGMNLGTQQKKNDTLVLGSFRRQERLRIRERQRHS